MCDTKICIYHNKWPIYLLSCTRHFPSLHSFAELMVSWQGLDVVHALHECPSLHETMSQDVLRPVSTNKYQRRVWNLTITVLETHKILCGVAYVVLGHMSWQPPTPSTRKVM